VAVIVVEAWVATASVTEKVEEVTVKEEEMTVAPLLFKEEIETSDEKHYYYKNLFVMYTL